MTFKELIRVLALGFAQDLPYVGSVIKAYATVVRADRVKERRRRERQEFLNEIGFIRLMHVLFRGDRGSSV
jgi:hypothetical protein